MALEEEIEGAQCRHSSAHSCLTWLLSAVTLCLELPSARGASLAGGTSEIKITSHRENCTQSSAAPGFARAEHQE